MIREHLLKLRQMIVKASASLSDNDALEAVELFPVWKVPVDYVVDDRLQYDGRLYKVLQSHTSQADWTPDVATSLYAEVERTGQGVSPEDPIPYNNNMALIKDKYYIQADVVYICTRSTEVPVYNDLAALVGLYVEVYVA